MARRKNPTDDYQFEVMQGEEMTEADANALARMTARLIYEQIMKEQQAKSDHNPNENNDQSTPTVKNE